MKFPKLIYYADDDQEDLQILEDVATELGHNIRVFTSGTELVRAVCDETIKPDIIFLDLIMPIVSGREILGEIRKCADFDNIPIVMFSTIYQGRQIIAEYINEGANYILTKPNSFKEFLPMFSEILSIDWQVYKPVPEDFL